MLSTIAGLIETVTGKGNAERGTPGDRDAGRAPVRVTVVGTGGAGGNAVGRMSDAGVRGVRMLALNTDVQALSRLKRAHTFAIGPNTTGGMGSGGPARDRAQGGQGKPVAGSRAAGRLGPGVRDERDGRRHRHRSRARRGRDR